MRSLIDQFCPNIHDAPITAAAYDRYHVVDGDSPVVEAEWPRVNGW